MIMPLVAVLQLKQLDHLCCWWSGYKVLHYNHMFVLL